jgi:hypothetical protein
MWRVSIIVLLLINILAFEWANNAVVHCGTECTIAFVLLPVYLTLLYSNVIVTTLFIFNFIKQKRRTFASSLLDTILIMMAFSAISFMLFMNRFEIR